MTFTQGMEVAASLVTSAASVTVIGRDTTPFMASLGEQVPGGEENCTCYFCSGGQVPIGSTQREQSPVLPGGAGEPVYSFWIVILGE